MDLRCTCRFTFAFSFHSWRLVAVREETKRSDVFGKFFFFVRAPDVLLSRLESSDSYASRRVKTSRKTRADFRASNGQIGTGISEFHVLLPKFGAVGALFAETEVICDATQDGQRQVPVVSSRQPQCGRGARALNFLHAYTWNSRSQWAPVRFMGAPWPIACCCGRTALVPIWPTKPNSQALGRRVKVITRFVGSPVRFAGGSLANSSPNAVHPEVFPGGP